jgi:hypothetical protein
MPAFAAARALPYVKDATIFGRELHLVVDQHIGFDRLRSDLVASARRIDTIEHIEPSLEDVFVALTRERHAA